MAKDLSGWHSPARIMGTPLDGNIAISIAGKTKAVPLELLRPFYGFVFWGGSRGGTLLVLIRMVDELADETVHLLGHVATPKGRQLTPAAQNEVELWSTASALAFEIGLDIDGAAVGTGSNYVPAI